MSKTIFASLSAQDFVKKGGPACKQLQQLAQSSASCTKNFWREKKLPMISSDQVRTPQQPSVQQLLQLQLAVQTEIPDKLILPKLSRPKFVVQTPLLPLAAAERS